MLAVLILCVCFLSPVRLEDVASTNIQETSSKPVELQAESFNAQENVGSKLSSSEARKSEELGSLQIIKKLNNEKTSTETPACPNSGVFLKIFQILTNSLSEGTVEPNKFKDVLSDIKAILDNAPLNTENYNLYNDFKTLEDELNSKNTKGTGLRSIVHDDNKLKAKISLQYDLPTTHRTQCQDIFFALVSYINNVYYQFARYCLITGRCYINDLPKISIGGTSNMVPNNQLLNQLPNPYPNYLPNIQASPGNVNSKEKDMQDILNLIQNYQPGSESNPTDINNPNSQYNYQYTIPGISQGQLNKPGYNIFGESPKQLLTDKNPKYGNFNNLPWQDIYSGLKDTSVDSKIKEEYLKILAEKYYSDNNGNKNTDSDNILTNILKNPSNVEPSVAVNQPLTQKLLPGLDLKEGNKVTNLDTQNQVPVLKSPNSNIQLPLNYLQQQPNTLDIYKEILANLGNAPHNSILNNAYQAPNYGINKNGVYGLLNPYNSAQNQILSNKLPIANSQYGSYVNNQQIQFPDYTQSGVTNEPKLNTIPNQSGFVELTYMLKRPRPTYEPLYYVKYRMPYPTFLYNLQSLLIQKPYLRNDPKQLYQELLLRSNITEASKDLKNLKHEEIVNLISKNGTLVTAKILQANDSFVEEQLKIVQDLNSNLSLAESNATSNLEIIEQIKNANMENLTNVAMPPYTSDVLKQLEIKKTSYNNFSPARMVNYKTGNKVYPNYPTFQTAYGLAQPKYGYSALNKIQPSAASNLQTYLSTFSKSG